jgi:hypothetical protein
LSAYPTGIRIYKNYAVKIIRGEAKLFIPALLGKCYSGRKEKEEKK